MLTISHNGRKASAHLAGSFGRGYCEPKRLQGFLHYAANGGNLEVYQALGAPGSEVDDFSRALAAIGPSGSVDLHVAVSEGGCPFTGLGIYSLLTQHAGRVVAHIDGLARGPAALICMSADEINMSASAHMILENPIGAVYGNVEEVAEMRNVLTKVGSTMATLFARRAGLRQDSIANLMADSTWLNADDAKSYGLADRVTPAKRAAENGHKYGDFSSAAVAARLRAIGVN